MGEVVCSKATTVAQVCDISGLKGGVGFGKEPKASTGAEAVPPKCPVTGSGRRERLRAPVRVCLKQLGSS